MENRPADLEIPALEDLEAPNTYNTDNAHPRDGLLHFEESTHTYTYAGGELRSVTTLVGDCFPKFDAELWAPRTAARMGISPEEVIRMWDEKAELARNLGTKMHAMIERHYLGHTNETDDTYRLFEQFTKFYHLQPYRTEWPVFDEDLGVAGTIDFLEYADGTFTIYDWKRSDKLVSAGNLCTENRFGQTGLAPLTHLPDTAYWHYALQLSIYRYILGRKYGINVSRGRLGVFHPSHPTFYVLDMPYLSREMFLIFGK